MRDPSNCWACIYFFPLFLCSVAFSGYFLNLSFYPLLLSGGVCWKTLSSAVFSHFQWKSLKNALKKRVAINFDLHRPPLMLTLYLNISLLLWYKWPLTTTKIYLNPKIGLIFLTRKMQSWKLPTCGTTLRGTRPFRCWHGRILSLYPAQCCLFI